MPGVLSLSGQNLTVARIRAAIAGGQRLALTADARRRIRASRAIVDRLHDDPTPHYGINTGFGILAHKRVPPADIEKLQENLILSHAVGVGAEVPAEIVRLMLLLKVNGLAVGLSGVTERMVNHLIRFYNEDALPIVYTKGSLGASGDLAPLAHMVLPLLGLGDMHFKGRRMKAVAVLRQLGLKPLKLQSKEGLGLINGTQFMSAYGVHCLLRIENLQKNADIAAAMTLEAARGSSAPFDARIHAARPHQGQRDVAQNLRTLLKHSEILPSHADCPKVQDPYSLRCIPQVHGACRGAIAHARSVVETEINSATDNPLVFENGDIVSGGNFHGQPLALALDFAAIALAEYASISERRIYQLLEGHDGLPKLLMRETGLNSGFMIPQYTAAALVSENKILCHPASVDSIPTSLGQEDHVSMGSIGAVKLWQVFKNVETVLAIEMLTAAQALDYRAPLRPGRGVDAAHHHVRAAVPHREADYLFRDDLARVFELVRGRGLLDAAGL